MQASDANPSQGPTEQAMLILARTRNVNLTVAMPSYEGHVGDNPRPMTRVEKALIRQFPGHSLADDVQTPPGIASLPSARHARPWVPT